MRNIFKKIIVWKLTVLAQLYLKIYKPNIIAVTGNVGKTSTKEAIAAVLSFAMPVRYSKGNLNNEFGVPLTILGNWGDDYYEKGSSPLFWLVVLVKSFFGILFIRTYPKVLVLEYGADAPGDIKRMVKLYRPDIAVVTAIGEIPVHVEYFQDRNDLAREKSNIVSALPQNGFAVLNYDDQLVLSMREKTKAHIKTFGLGDNSNVRAGKPEVSVDEYGRPMGVKFKIHHGENAYVPVLIKGCLGKAQAYVCSAATAIGLIKGMNLVDIAQALNERYSGVKGRSRILEGIKNTIIIDDTYNAAPASTHIALETLKELPGQRKIAILGDMLELGKYSIQAHQEIGNIASRCADVVFFVGARMKLAAEAALDTLGKDMIYTFETSNEAKIKVQEIIQAGDVILVKGSQGIRMERIVEEIMAQPERKKELLVRQSGIWQNKSI